MAKLEVEFSQLTVLVVEDQDVVRTIIVQLLRKIGVGTVLQAPNGAEALRMVESAAPDLILCDIKMKPVDGLEFLHDVRAGLVGRDPYLPIIFLTSASDQDTVRAALDGDIDAYMVKPVSAGDLKAKILGVMTRRQANRGIDLA